MTQEEFDSRQGRLLADLPPHLQAFVKAYAEERARGEGYDVILFHTKEVVNGNDPVLADYRSLPIDNGR